MKLKTLCQKHSCCDQEIFLKYQALYEGGQMFHQHINKFLSRNQLEGMGNYGSRKSQAFYESYVNSIVNQFAAQLFSSPFVIRTDPEDSDPFYAEFKEDCDLCGQDLMNFMRDQFITSLIKGCSWILAEMPFDEAPPPENLLDYNQRNLGRAWLCAIQPDQVYDWERDEFGQLQWAITYDCQIRRDDPRLERSIVTETWKLYDPEFVETFQIKYQQGQRPNEELDVPSLGRIRHGFTRVPLLEMRLPKGLWILNRLADVQTEHFRANNDLAWAMRRACNPTAVFETSDVDDGQLVASQDGFAVKIAKDDKLYYVEVPTEAFTTMMNRVSSLEANIYKLATQMALAVDTKSAAALGRSGDSKAQDAQATEICLHAFASLVKDTVEEIFELVSDARGDLELTFSIEGMDQFNVLDVDGILNAVKIAKELGIDSEKFRKESQAKAAEALLFNVSQEIKDEIRAQIMASPEPKKPDIFKENLPTTKMPEASQLKEDSQNNQ